MHQLSYITVTILSCKSLRKHTFSRFQILTTDESMLSTFSWEWATSRMGSPYMWSLTRMGLSERRSYNSTWPVAVPTLSPSAPWKVSAVTDGNPAMLQQAADFSKSSVLMSNITRGHKYKEGYYRISSCWTGDQELIMYICVNRWMLMS